jgi:hypothetical protein
MDGDPPCETCLSSPVRHEQRYRRIYTVVLLVLLACIAAPSEANPDAKRLYDDLLSNYNRLIRPVSNNTDTVLVKLGLRLSQLIDLVSTASIPCNNYSI